MTSSAPSSITMRPSATWMTSLFTPPPSQTIGESPRRYSRPFIPISCFSNQKCKFERQEVDYLGLVISKDHIAMDPVKVQGVTDWPQLMKVKDVQSFIGLVNFYRRIIRHFSEIACPLHVLTQQLTNWSWGAAEQQAFDALQNAVT